jgi:hypothetical protein
MVHSLDDTQKGYYLCNDNNTHMNKFIVDTQTLAKNA